MLSLTRQERILVLFLAVFVICGISINYILKRIPAMHKFYNCANLHRPDVQLSFDINKASLEELVRLPGIEEGIALRIIQYRQAQGGFKDIGELENVAGIGPKKLQAIRQHIRFK